MSSATVQKSETAYKEPQTMNKVERDVVDSSKAISLINRHYTTPDKHPFDKIEWQKTSASIINETGKVIFEQKDIEAPKSWSQMAISVVASKYFNYDQKTKIREESVKTLINRVAKTISDWGIASDYFNNAQERDAFYDELCHILVNQTASFNSPVWFNCGVEEKPQCSACFINSVEDRMDSILELAKTEGMLFKWGSGSGTNLSSLRSSQEALSTGGMASGPVSFMKGFDAFAGVIKSGGKTRRAAKMVILNADHPDIIEFINCKFKEEKKAHILIDNGYDGSFNGEAYSSIFFQNANNSVRVTDAFMKTVEENTDWYTNSVVENKKLNRYNGRELFKLIANASHACGDPGLQYDTTINSWHTCPNSGRINASNPCSEFMFLDDSACNLASINLMKFLNEDGTFDIDSFQHTVSVMTLAQDIIVDNASYPTEKITTNSKDFRPLGLGYANMGALLMALGLPYDSDDGRQLASTITSLLTGHAYKTSANISKKLKPFKHFAKNDIPMLNVIKKHLDYHRRIKKSELNDSMYKRAELCWEEALHLGGKTGFRNSQVTVLAPTGTIGFMMDCDTTGIEPDMALIKYKKLVGGGMLKIVNKIVPITLKHLGYSQNKIDKIIDYINKNDTIEGCDELMEEHLEIFDCAFKPLNGSRSIGYMGHVKMMAAVQPFISGAISKTVNMPGEATPDDVQKVYLDAWKLGLKSISIYRDGSKRTQPLSVSKEDGKPIKKDEKTKPIRKRLKDERSSITHKFSIGGHEGYITVGMYDDGQPGEIFIVMAKQGSVISGLMDSFATAISLALQYGVPLKVLVNKFVHTRFEPSGITNNKDIRMAKSVMDYIFRWLALKFLPTEEQPNGFQSLENGVHNDKNKNSSSEKIKSHEKEIFDAQSDAPPCSVCESLMVRSGTCYKCLNCGTVSGCS